MSSFTPGLKLHDRYLLEQRIGVGGMAEVWRAHDLVLGRSVAVKVLSGAIAADPVLRAGAQREARAAAALNHPNITAVHDYGEAVFPDHHVEPYLVMELLSGDTLARRLECGPLPWPQVAGVGAQVASALAAAHAQGVVHRDIKPANIMLTGTGAKVLDFGIAALAGHTDPAAGRLIGTPAYTAPERLREDTIDPSADVYALGVVLAEAVTGVRPVAVDTWQDAASAHAAARPEPQLSGLPPAAAALIRDCLDPLPARRPTAAAVARALGSRPSAAAQHTLVAPMGGMAITGTARVPSPAARPHHTQVAETPSLPAKRRFSPSAVALIMVLVVVSVALVRLAAMEPSDQPASGNAASSTLDSPSTTAPTEATKPATDGAALLVRLRDTVAAQDITGKRQRDLLRQIAELRGRWERGRFDDVVDKAGSLRDDIDDYADEGRIPADTADRLRELLDGLIDAARQAEPASGGD